jgi:ATP-dependent Clp protease ATP-binding subunit ClpC
LAQEEARDLGHDYIGTEHLLLGLLKNSGSTAHQVLTRLQAPPETVRRKVSEHVRPGDKTMRGHVPFSLPAKKALEFSLREALQLGHSHIGSGHLLLGLLREEKGTAARVLTELGVDLDRARSLVGETGDATDATDATEGPAGPRTFGASAFREIPDRLKGIEDRLAAIEARLAAIETRLEPPATPRSL